MVPEVELARCFDTVLFRSGWTHMDRTKRISLWAACLEIGGYPELLLNLARTHGLEIHVNGRGRYVYRQDLERLAWHVREWLNRPRMSRNLGTAGRPALKPARRPGKAPSKVIGES